MPNKNKKGVSEEINNTLTLEKLRKFFPDWPSEYDEAKQAELWALFAQEYYCAAIIINDEITKTRKFLNENKNIQITEDIGIRMHGHAAAIFCLAFSIELLVKAVFIKCVANKSMKPNQKIDFANHKISILIKEINEIVIIDEKEKALIKTIEQIILYGKYPTNKEPSDKKTREKLPDFHNFKLLAEPLYKKLISKI